MVFLLFLSFYLLDTIVIAQPHCPDWDYKDPSEWPLCYPFCGGQHVQEQSPIEISDEYGDASFPELIIRNYDDPGNIILRHFPQELEAVYPEGYQGGFTFAGFDYVLKEIHFHTPGEHTFSIRGADKSRYDMEMHMVHEHDIHGLAVIAIFWQKTDIDNAWLSQITKNLSDIRNINQTMHVSISNLADNFVSLKSRYLSGYWTYNGSLTTPPCTEGVRWILMQQPWYCSSNQVNEIQQNFLQNNTRPIQQQNIRIGGYYPRAPPQPAISEGVAAAIAIGAVLFIVSVGTVVGLYVRRRKTSVGEDNKKLLDERR